MHVKYMLEILYLSITLKNLSLTDKIGVKTELSRFFINSVRHLGFRKKSIFYFNLASVNM